MPQLINWLKMHCKSRIFRACTIIALLVLYLIIFHNDIYQQFMKFIFLTAFEQLVTNIINDKTFVTSVGVAFCAFLAWIKK
jgi:hypothetical protein